MNRIPWIAAAWMVLEGAVPARAGGFFPPAPVPQRVGLADVVVVGTVTGFADKLVSAPRYPGGTDSAEFQVARVRVNEAVGGGNELKEIKVGFIPSPNPDGMPSPALHAIGQLTLDEQALFFLVARPDAPFFEAQDAYGVIESTDAHFKKACEEARRCAKLLADPRAGLKAKNAEDRLLTTALLVTRYRMPRIVPAPAGTEEVDADESKLLLQTLADADWGAHISSAVSGTALNAQMIFMQIDVRKADGWKEPDDPSDYQAAAKQWLRDHVENYRLRRYVYDAGPGKKDAKQDR